MSRHCFQEEQVQGATCGRGEDDNDSTRGGACGSERGVIEGQDRGKDGTDEREYVFGRGR